MKRSEVRKLSAVCRLTGSSRGATRSDLEPFVGARRRHFMEVQWQGRGGKFRHLALSPPGLRIVMGTLAMVALLGGAHLVWSKRAPASFNVRTVLRESTELQARQYALRERAFALAEQLYGRVEQGRRIFPVADTPAQVSERLCPRPPLRKAGNEAILAWLAEFGTRLETIGDGLPTGRRELGATQASGSVPLSEGRATAGGESALLVADTGQPRHVLPAPARR